MKRSILIFLAISSLYSLAMAQDFIGKAKVSLSVHDTVNAVQAFKDAVKANQKPGEADYYLGIIAFAQQHMDDAQGFPQPVLQFFGVNLAARIAFWHIVVVPATGNRARAVLTSADCVARVLCGSFTFCHAVGRAHLGGNRRLS